MNLIYFLLIGKTGITKVESFAPTVSAGIHWHPRKRLLPDLSDSLAFGLSSASVVDADTEVSSPEPKATNKIGNVVFLIPSINSDSIISRFGRSSPVESPSILEAVEHLAKKSCWFADEQIDTVIVPVPESEDARKFQQLCQSDVIIAMGLQSKNDVQYAKNLFEKRRSRDPGLRRRQCHFALDCSESIPSLVGPYDEIYPSLQSILFPWTNDATGRRLWEQMSGLFNRWTSDDFCCALMLFLNQFSGSPVDWVRYTQDATWEKGPVQNAKEFYGMVNKCGDCIGRCLADDNCRECITKLTEVDSRDQVASYRTITSYESDLLTEFSLCILTKNNIFGCKAKIPDTPMVTPITTFRGKALTEEAGRSILVAHLDDDSAPEGSLRMNTSWVVACGANVAYDQFPSQNQLFYPAARGRDMWYDPVFRVTTLDGREIWCKRHYKVRPGPAPGTFRLSVLDSGVTSNEFWTIVAVAGDLSWVVFHYAGAAAAVGLAYLGGLLCTPDGSVPEKERLPEIWDAMRSAGFQPWELYVVNNDPSTPAAKEAGPAPLNYYRDQLLANRERSRRN